MSKDDTPPTARTSSKDGNDDNATASVQLRRRFNTLFSIPPPMKRVFDKFPVVTYGANELPTRAPRSRDDNVLHVFTSPQDASAGKPSFNPACLKWQTYLRFVDIPFRTVPSNNHASPSGALPFLLPAVSTSESAKLPDPVPGNKLKRWTTSQKTSGKVKEPEDVRYEAYASLLENRIRMAWLYQVYLDPANASLLQRLYIAPCSSNPFVQATIAHQLRSAAESELIKASGSNTIIEDDIFRDAGEAFEALGTLLAEDQWFFGQEKPGLFDASVFAYTRLILDDRLGWHANRLRELLEERDNLVRHQQRIADLYF